MKNNTYSGSCRSNCRMFSLILEKQLGMCPVSTKVLTTLDKRTSSNWLKLKGPETLNKGTLVARSREGAIILSCFYRQYGLDMDSG